MNTADYTTILQLVSGNVNTPNARESVVEERLIYFIDIIFLKCGGIFLYALKTKKTKVSYISLYI